VPRDGGRCAGANGMSDRMSVQVETMILRTWSVSDPSAPRARGALGRDHESVRRRPTSSGLHADEGVTRLLLAASGRPTSWLPVSGVRDVDVVSFLVDLSAWGTDPIRHRHTSSALQAAVAVRARAQHRRPSSALVRDAPPLELPVVIRSPRPPAVCRLVDDRRARRVLNNLDGRRPSTHRDSPRPAFGRREREILHLYSSGAAAAVGPPSSGIGSLRCS